MVLGHSQAGAFHSHDLGQMAYVLSQSGAFHSHDLGKMAEKVCSQRVAFYSRVRGGLAEVCSRVGVRTFVRERLGRTV